MKTIMVNGTAVNGSTRAEITAKLNAMGLSGKARNDAFSVLGRVFSKKQERAGSSKRHGNRHGVQVKDPSNVSRKEMRFDGVTLEIFEGPTQKVLGFTKGRTRNVVLLATETFVKNGTTVLVMLKGRYDKIQYGRIDKDALQPYFKREGYSFITSLKAVGNRREGVKYVATGQNLAQPNVRALLQQLASQSYEGTALRGATIGGKEISTVVFLAPDTVKREAAIWPAKNPGAFALTDIGSLPVTYLGDHGIAAVTEKGEIRAMTFLAMITAAAAGLFNQAGKATEVAWTRLEGLDLKQIGNKIIDVAISQSHAPNTYKVLVTGPGKVAILTVAWKDNAFVLEGKPEYKAFNYSDMAFIGRASDHTAVLANRNGGPTALEFVPTSDLQDLGFAPMAMKDAQAPEAQA
mgnify:CR=1 FL=1